MRKKDDDARYLDDWMFDYAYYNDPDNSIPTVRCAPVSYSEAMKGAPKVNKINKQPVIGYRGELPVEY